MHKRLIINDVVLNQQNHQCNLVLFQINDSVDLISIISKTPQHIGWQQSLTAAYCGRNKKMTLNQQGH